MKTIFFSWQSDIKPARNKFKKALDIVARNLDKDVEEADRPEVDSDTQGIFGSEDILTTIFSKIDKCSVFVADVTPIVQTKNKLIPNPNVMTELGYAIKAKNPNTRLFVFLSDKQINMDKMPFDIRGKTLIGFNSTDTPVKIAETLEPRIKGMLSNTKSSTALLEHPYIYVSGSSYTRWADGESMSFDIKSDETEEFFLEMIGVDKHFTNPNRSLTPKGVTKGIVLNGSIQPFTNEHPKIKMIVSRGNRSYIIEQDIKTSGRADGRYNLAQFVERPSVISSFDKEN